MSGTSLLPSSTRNDRASRSDTDSSDTPAGGRDNGLAGLVEGAARSERGAWDTLVRRHEKRVTAIARAHGLCEADVADVVQTVWLRLLEHIDRIQHPERVGSWLATTTRNECMRVWRHRGRVRLLADPGLLDMVVDDTLPEPRVDTHDRDIQLRSAVATLPPVQQAILGMLMSDPAPSYLQVANDLDIPVGSIGPNRQRCLKTLHGKCLGLSIGIS